MSTHFIKARTLAFATVAIVSLSWPAQAESIDLTCNIGKHIWMTDGTLTVHVDFSSGTVVYAFNSTAPDAISGHWTAPPQPMRATDQIISWGTTAGGANCGLIGCPGSINRVSGEIKLWWLDDGYVGGPCTAVPSPTPKF